MPIPIIEDYLSELLNTRLSSIRSNVESLNNIFGGNTRTNSLKNFLADNQVKVIRGYPRTPASLPCICILLSGEEEQQEGLGDYVEDDLSHLNNTSEEVTAQLDQQGNVYFTTKYKPIDHVQSVVNNDLGTTVNKSDIEIANPYKGDVICYDESVESGDSLTVEYTYKEMSVESNSTMFDGNYRLEVWAGNADLVVEIYHLCKWILLSGRDFLGDDKELYQQRISGADFEPAPNFFPDFVYRRALLFWCKIGVSAPVGESTYITDINVNASIEGEEEDTNG